MMKHRDRVLMALHHEVPDRCPMQFSFTPEFAARLRADSQLQSHARHNPQGGDLYELERTLDQDMLLTSIGRIGSNDPRADPHVDEWGVGWLEQPYSTPFGEGIYTEIVSYPLADEAALDTYQPPDPSPSALYAKAERTIREFKDEYWIVGVAVTTIFETAWALRGLEQMLIDFALDPDLADRILDIPYHFHLTLAKKLVAMGVDMIWTGDDVGAQHTMLISPDHWRRYLKPRMANFIAELKAINPALKVAYHSDGYILPIIPELIEIGVDVLNPIQPASMSPAEIKRAFGDRLCFWGSIDEQYTLPWGTPETVRAEVIERLHTIGQGGGLIIGPTHNVQLDTPLENFWAMVHAITETPYPGG